MMKTFSIALEIAGIVVLILVGVLLLVFFWPLVIPGVVLWWILRERYQRWIGAMVALLVVLIFRISSGSWQVAIGGQSSGEWHVELALGLLSWAIGSILVAAGYHIPRYLHHGLRFKDGPGPEDPA